MIEFRDAVQSQFNSGMRSSESSEWETPRVLFENLNAEFGFTLDVCATPGNAKCAKYFTKETDGLTQDWAPNVCWMNPEYGRRITLWMAKAKAEWDAGATVVCLVPARTDTKWWHEFVIQTGAEVRFLKGRVKFVRADGKTGPAPFPSAIVVYR